MLRIILWQISYCNRIFLDFFFQKKNINFRDIFAEHDGRWAILINSFLKLPFSESIKTEILKIWPSFSCHCQKGPRTFKNWGWRKRKKNIFFFKAKKTFLYRRAIIVLYRSIGIEQTEKNVNCVTRWKIQNSFLIVC